MAFTKRHYTDKETIITAKNMNDIQDAIIMLEGGLFTVDNEKSGEAITITDAARRGLRGLKLYGKTTQDGTPTPEAPVELVSVGSGGNITVNITGEGEAQSMAIATPNGLPGIPVSSGGNYTDANGQQWICDEIDFARGVHIQRVGLASKKMRQYSLRAIESQLGLFQVLDFKVKKSSPVMSNLFIDGYTHGVNYTISTKRGDTDNVYFYYSEYTTTEALISAKGEDVLTIAYVLEAPIETPLSEEELAAYAHLHTYKEVHTVSNDAGAYMELEYVMDAKKYIDLQTEAGHSAPVTEYWNYAGTVLPKFEYNPVVHPCVCIVKKGDVCQALCCAELWSVNGGVIRCTANVYSLVDGAWVLDGKQTITLSVADITVIWTSTKIADTNGTVYVEASAPPTQIRAAKNIYIVDMAGATEITNYDFLSKDDVILMAMSQT